MSVRRAGLYARVSTPDQDPAGQVEELRRVAERRGWGAGGVYEDHGVSGTHASRPALDRLMHDARSGRIEVVAVVRFDRFARSTQHLLAALDEFRLLGIEFISLREGVDTGTAAGKMVFTFLAAVAEFERALIIERVRSGIARARAKGRHCGRPRRHVSLKAVDALLAQGHSLRSAALELKVPRSTIQRRLRERERGGPKASPDDDLPTAGPEVAHNPGPMAGP